MGGRDGWMDGWRGDGGEEAVVEVGRWGGTTPGDDAALCVLLPTVPLQPGRTFSHFGKPLALELVWNFLTPFFNYL